VAQYYWLPLWKKRYRSLLMGRGPSCVAKGPLRRKCMRSEAISLQAEGRAKESGALRIRLLGGFSVSVGESKVDESAWRLRKAASLIKLLALAPSHRLHRERAMDLLWPELGKKAASNNLRQTLHAARRALASDPAEGSRYLASEDESLLLCPGGNLGGGYRCL
jgi:two-component SAPR family response regulator